jgi:integrase
MRRGEVSGADWIIPGARYKTKLDHVIPLPATAKALLPPDGDWVFTTTGTCPIGGFNNFKIDFDMACGVTGWTIHDLRRTSRSLMSRAGIPADIAERCLGHVMGGVRGTYDRYEYRDEKLQAFETLAALIERIVHPQDNIVPLRAAQ